MPFRPCKSIHCQHLRLSMHHSSPNDDKFSPQRVTLILSPRSNGAFSFGDLSIPRFPIFGTRPMPPRDKAVNKIVTQNYLANYRGCTSEAKTHSSFNSYCAMHHSPSEIAMSSWENNIPREVREKRVHCIPLGATTFQHLAEMIGSIVIGSVGV